MCTLISDNSLHTAFAINVDKSLLLRTLYIKISAYWIKELVGCKFFGWPLCTIEKLKTVAQLRLTADFVHGDLYAFHLLLTQILHPIHFIYLSHCVAVGVRDWLSRKHLPLCSWELTRTFDLTGSHLQIWIRIHAFLIPILDSGNRVLVSRVVFGLLRNWVRLMVIDVCVKSVLGQSGLLLSFERLIAVLETKIISP